MISESKLQELLHDNVPESETIDFKSEAYRLVNEDLKSRFIKDVLSMANTPREGTSYIVIGIKLNPDGTKARIGVQGKHPDDADLQKCLNLAGVQPRPRFSYQPIILEGLSYGVVAIPVTNEGPYIPTKKYGLLLPSVLYFRRGSGNDEADANDLTRIVSWFYQRPPCRGTPPRMKKGKIGARMLWPRDRFLIVPQSQHQRLIRVCVGTTYCCPSWKRFFRDGARRGESLFLRTHARCIPSIRRQGKQKNWEIGDGDTLHTLRRM